MRLFLSDGVVTGCRAEAGNGLWPAMYMVRGATLIRLRCAGAAVPGAHNTIFGVVGDAAFTGYGTVVRNVGRERRSRLG